MTKKLMTTNKALHPRDDIDRLYVSRKERGKALASIEDSVDASMQRLEDYIKKECNERLIIATRNSIDNIKINRTTILRKQKTFRKTTI